MKFNFKKIASVLATTVMLGSTIGFAMAAYPEPFVKSGAADAALVYGAAGAASDMSAATDLGASLDAKVTTTGGAISGTGDKVKLDRTSDKIHIGDGLTTAWGTSLTKSDLPTLLADGVFNNKQNTEYKYTQKFSIGNVTFSHFSDSDLNNRVPALGFNMAANTWVANYTLQFTTNPESAVGSSYDLTDLETKTIKMMGKDYYILDFKNSSSGKITLLDAASTSSISEGETKTLTVNGKTYEVAISFISTDEVILTVNGVNTEKLSATGTTYGNTYKLADGTYVGIKTINVQAYAGGTKNVDFSLGTGKLEINGAGGSVKINDKSIDDLYGWFTFSNNAGKAQWQKLVMEWKLSDKNFLTPGKELTMPGFEAIKFTMADTTVPKKETTTITYGSTDYVQIKTTIKDGAVTIPILYIDSTTGNVSGIGQSATQRLATANTTSLTYNTTSGGTQYEGFIVSWQSSATPKDAETYYLHATTRYESDTGRNLTTIKNKVTGNNICEDIQPSDTCSIGSLTLTVDAASGKATSNESGKVAMLSCSSCSFQHLYTADGLMIELPFSLKGIGGGAAASSRGALNITNDTSENQPTQFVLWMIEADKDGTKNNGGVFNVTLGKTGSGTTYKHTVDPVYGAGTLLETSTGSKIWEGYVKTALGTKVTQTKTNSDQYSVDVEYHGEEAYANVYVAAPSVTTTGSAKIAVVKDSEVDSVKDKNLIVVGGACVNKAAAMIVAGADAALCGDAWAAKTGAGAGKYLIQVAASPYNAAKIAMLVAGYDAADTTSAVAKVKEGKESTEIGSVVYPLATA